MHTLAIMCLLVHLIAAGDSSPLSRNRFKLMFHYGNNNGSRIVGGVPAIIGQIPYIVSLRYTNTGSHFCGGSIVASRSIVTVAHCVYGYNSLAHNSGGTLVNCASIYVHESYNSATIDSDIAVLHLAEPIDLSLPYVAIVDLPAQGHDPQDGEVVYASGWGTLSEGSGTLPTALQVVTVTIVGREKCNALYGIVGGITVRMICAGGDGRDKCQGDSGGPLVSSASKELWGAILWGYGCGRPNYPGVYTRIGIFVDWIRSRIY